MKTIPIKFTRIGTTVDDVPIIKHEMCLHFDCQRWVKPRGSLQVVAVAPKLEVNDRGFLVCPKCGYSYGAASEPIRDSKGRALRGLDRISFDERRRLLAFASNNGRNWRSKLRREWERGSAVLREARNVLGPSGLDEVKL